MKIGIMTFHAAPNHGAALQAYALQTHLQKMGHEPFFINYQRGARPLKGLRGWFGGSIERTLHKIGAKLKRRPFDHFQKKFLNIKGRDYSDHIQLQNDPPVADAYICGSDQIWNPFQISLQKDEHAFWLDFGFTGAQHIAYAASFGTFELSKEVTERYAEYARYFDNISVRENSAEDIAKSLGVLNPICVPDPTLLLDQNEYRKIEMGGNEKSNPFVFSYQIESGEKQLTLAAQINKIIRSELKLEVYESLSMSFFYNIIYNRYIGPSEWLGRLRQSEFVFTNSFHATVFSLLFHHPFIVKLRTGALAGSNSRIESLLELVGLGNRAIADFNQNQIAELCQEKIDWTQVDDKIQAFREIGYQFLSDTLNKRIR